MFMLETNIYGRKWTPQGTQRCAVTVTSLMYICQKAPANEGPVDLNPFPLSSSRARSSCFAAPGAAAAGQLDSRGFGSAGRIFTNATEMWAAGLGSTAATSSAAEAEATPAATATACDGAAGEEAGGEEKRKEWYSKAIA
jgi:hypothetical protein